MTFPEAVLALSGSPELSVLFKATVLLTPALALLQLAGRARASVRHLVLAGTFAALAALPVVMAAVPGLRMDITIAPAKPVHAVAAATVPAIVSPGTAAPEAARGWVTPPWTTLLRVVWAGGAMLQLALLGWQLLRLRRIRRSGIPWLEGRDSARMLARECGVSRTVDVLLHEEIEAPVTCGTIRPVIL